VAIAFLCQQARPAQCLWLHVAHLWARALVWRVSLALLQMPHPECGPRRQVAPVLMLGAAAQSAGACHGASAAAQVYRAAVTPALYMGTQRVLDPMHITQVGGPYGTSIPIALLRALCCCYAGWQPWGCLGDGAGLAALLYLPRECVCIGACFHWLAILSKAGISLIYSRPYTELRPWPWQRLLGCATPRPIPAAAGACDSALHQ
jgi:hypothetical protein